MPQRYPNITWEKILPTDVVRSTPSAHIFSHFQAPASVTLIILAVNFTAWFTTNTWVMGSLFPTKIAVMSSYKRFRSKAVYSLHKTDYGVFWYDRYELHHKPKTLSFNASNFTTDWYYYKLNDWGIQNCYGNVPTLE